MEEPQRSRHVARTHISKKMANGKDFIGGRTVYDDVFGGSPKHSVSSFPPCIDDYKEIFRASSTVPFLEFSSGFCEGDGNGLLVSCDSYADIFGGNGDDFLLSFEDLVGRKEKRMTRKDSEGDHLRRSRLDSERKSSQKVPTKLSSMSVKASNGVLQNVPGKISSISPGNSDGRLFSILDNIPTLLDPAPQHLHEFEKQLNMSDLMTSNEFKEGPYGIEPVPDLMEDGSCYKDKRATSLTRFFGGSHSQTLRNKFHDDNGVIHTKPLPVENDPSSNLNIQASRGDYVIDKSTGVFLTITDINLQTHPSQLPPPSRPSPKLGLKSVSKKKLSSSAKNSHENGHSHTMPNNHGLNHIEVASETHCVEEDLKLRSPPFFDIEIDGNSDAAASAAAMKEVMEEAKAKLKFLKESMTKRGSLKTNRSLSGRQKIRGMEHEECEAAQEFFDCNIDIDHEVWDGLSVKIEHSGPIERAEFDSERSLSELKYVQTSETKKQVHDNKHADAQKFPEKEKVTKFSNDEEVHHHEPLVGEAEDRLKKPYPNEGNENNLKTYDTESKISVVLKTDDQKEVSDRIMKGETSIMSHNTYERKEKAIQEHVEGETGELKQDNVAHGNGQNAQVFRMAQDISDVDASKMQPESDPKVFIREIEEKQVEGYREISPADEHTFQMAQQEDEEKKKLNNDQKNSKENEEECPIPVRCGNHEQTECSSMLNVNHAPTAPVIPDIVHRNKEKNADELVEQEDISMKEEANHAPRKQGIYHNNTENTVHELVEQEENTMQEPDTNDARTKQDIPCSNIADEPVVQEGISMSKAVQETLEHEQQEKDFIVNEDGGDCDGERRAKRSNMDRLFQESNKNSEASSRITQPEKEHVLQTANQANKEENTMQEPDTNDVRTKQDIPCSNIADEPVVQEGISMPKAVQEALEHEQQEKDFIVNEDDGDSDGEMSAKRSNMGCLFQESNKSSEASSHITQPEKEHVLQAANQANRDQKMGKFSETETHVKAQKEKAQLHKERLKREREQEMEMLMKLEEEKEREREREKDRIAVERATHEARDKAFADAWDEAERAAVERATAEARQRMNMDRQEKAETVPPEFKEKISAEKSSTEGKIRSDRSAIDRAEAEARERAAERAIVEKVAAEARERMERAVAEKFAASLREKRKKDYEWDNGASTRVNITKHTSTSEVQNFTRDTSHVATHTEVGVETEKRRQAKLERYQRTTERAAKALAEKKARDILLQREQAERHRLAETLDGEIRRWSNGKEGNFRALISTLQYILGSESGWQPVPLTEVITSAAVKKAYRKATLCVHPDKVQQRGASIQQKYISEKVFDLLKEAWNRFNSEERCQ